MAPNATYKGIELVHRAPHQHPVKKESPKKESPPNGRKRTPSPKKSKSKGKSAWSKLTTAHCLTLLAFIFFSAGLALFWVYFTTEPPKCVSDKEDFGWMATTAQHFNEVHLHDVKCHEPGYRRERMLKSAPKKCGTLIYDELVSMEENIELRKMAAKLVYEIGETNPYSRESINLHWVNLHNVFKKGYKAEVFNDTDFELIKKASERAKTVVAETFGLPRENLYFTTVAQFTRYRPMTRYSQFRHVDKVRSQSLVVTSILWLSNYDVDFGGGTTAFLTGGPKPFTPLLVQPKIGRFAAWTSGWENPHEVMQMLWGERLALIFAFTVNPYLGEKDMETMRTWAQSLPDNPFFG